MLTYKFNLKKKPIHISLIIIMYLIKREKYRFSMLQNKIKLLVENSDLLILNIKLCKR